MERVVGMTESSRLVVRTRFPMGKDGSFSSPMGFLAINSEGRWVEQQNGLSLFDWYGEFKTKPSLMIHGDNPDLQKRSIHGRLFINQNGEAELRLQSGTVHGREREGGKLLRLKGGWPLRESDVVTRFGNDPLVVWRKVIPWLDYLGDKYEEIKRFFGKNGVIEFRLYGEGINFPMQIYDVDLKF